MTIEELARRIDEYSREVAPYEYMDEEFDGADTIAETVEALETEPEHMLKIFEEERDWREDSAGEYGKYLYEEASDLCDEIGKLIKKGSNMLVEIYPNNRSGRNYDEGYFKDIEYYDHGVEWYYEGDGIIVFLDTKTNMEAVYRRYGGLLCLFERSNIYILVDNDDASDRDANNFAIQKMLVEEAVLQGFPKETPKQMKQYRLTIRRTAHITVEAESEDQARLFGEAIAGAKTEKACMIDNELMADSGDDELVGVSTNIYDYCKKVTWDEALEAAGMFRMSQELIDHLESH